MRFFDYIVGLSSVLALFIAYRSARHTKIKKLKCNSLLNLNDKVSAIIKITNIGVPNITIEKIALSLVIWEVRPRLRLTGLNFLLQILEGIWNYQQDKIYVSQSKINSPSNSNFPLTIEDSQAVEVSIDLIETIDNFFDNCVYLDRANYIWLIFYTLTIDVICTHKTYRFKPHREIRHFMLSQYNEWVLYNS